MGRITEIVKHLLIINIIFFFASSVLGEIMYDLFAMHYPNNPNFFIWQPITHMFMHGDLTHIMFNMFGLWMFGTPLEQMWGKQKFIFFYIIWICRLNRRSIIIIMPVRIPISKFTFNTSTFLNNFSLGILMILMIILNIPQSHIYLLT